jgi:uncharacterized protein
MTLQERVMEDMKTAMKTKDKGLLRGLRAIKAALLLAQTDGSGRAIDETREIEILQKLIKQRQDSLKIYQEQNRPDLAIVEKEELNAIQLYLPQQLSESELQAAIQAIMNEVGATSMKDMGKVMGKASADLKGKADNRLVSEMVKKMLS